jgi:hypothetical protein
MVKKELKSSQRLTKTKSFRLLIEYPFHYAPI